MILKEENKNQTLINLREVPIFFPFKPYDIQRDYMEKVLEALQKGENALLQSPTGTGKTLCLLSSALAWMKKQRETQEKS